MGGVLNKGLNRPDTCSTKLKKLMNEAFSLTKSSMALRHTIANRFKDFPHTH
jgi:hypothetical protein